MLDRDGFGTMYIEGLDLNAGAPYVAAFEFLGDAATDGQLIGQHTFPLAIDFTADFAGAYGFCDPTTLPTATTTVVIKKVVSGTLTSIGTMAIATDGVFTFTVASALSLAAGDSLQFVGPATADVTAANFSWSVIGSLASS